MRLTTPRIAPAPAESWTDEQREIVEPMLARGSVLNIFRDLADPSGCGKGLPGLGPVYPEPQEYTGAA